MSMNRSTFSLSPWGNIETIPSLSSVFNFGHGFWNQKSLVHKSWLWILGLSFIRAGSSAGCSDVLSPDLGAAHSSLPSTFVLVIMVLAVHWLYWQNDNDVKKFWRCLLWDLETAMAHHSSSLAWKIPWTEEQFTGSQRVRHNWATSLSLFTFMHWRRKWQPTPEFLPGESQGQRSLVGCRLWGRTESDTTEVT